MPDIRIRRRASGGAAGAPSTLLVGEPAYSEVDSILYIGTTGGVVAAMGGTGAFVGITGAQTVSGNKTFSGTLALGSSATATTPSTGDNSTKVATTAYVKAQSYLSANQSIALSGDATGSGTTSISVVIASAVVTNVKLASVATATIKGRVTSGTGAPEDLTAAQAKTVLAIVPGDISGFDTQVRTNPLNTLATATNAYNMGGYKITNLADPTSAQDAATKAYVDAARAGLNVKQAVRAISTYTITLSGLQTIDGVSLVAGDRVLVALQGGSPAPASHITNGIYVVASGAWSRASDADTSGKVTAGMFCFVTEGTLNKDTGWVLSTDDPITLGSTALGFAQFSAGGVPAGYTGQATIATLGTITTGVWQGTTIAAAYGGTGLTSVLTGLVKGNGSAYSAAVAGTDYLSPSSEIDGGTF